MADKYNRNDSFQNAMGDYGFGHGFNSRGMSPSYLGSDSLPQGISDVHWAMHGLADNVDQLDARMADYEKKIKEVTKGMEQDVVKHLSDVLTASKTALTNDTAYFTKVMTTRPRIFADSFKEDTFMEPLQRLRGFTKDYHWIAHTEKNPTCEGEYDKIVDFNYITDYEENDHTDTRFVKKGKIVLDKLGLLQRIYITQAKNNIAIYYLLTQSVPTQTGVGYTGTIKRVEYDPDGNLIRDAVVPLNHTPLVFLGAFNGDPNNEYKNEFIQYISTDYKMYQNVNGTDLLLGQLPNNIITLIDPVNDIVSDTKQAYIFKYDNDGNLKFPIDGFTMLDTVSGDKILDRFSLITFKNSDSNIINNIKSITPRTATQLIKEFTPDKQMVVEGGYYCETYDRHKGSNEVWMPTSHIFLLSSTEEVNDTEFYQKNMFNYWMDEPSPFGLKRERDYMEFPSITFRKGAYKLFPEIYDDFGIDHSTRLTIKFDVNTSRETIIFWLPEPFVLERSTWFKAVDNRLGYNVKQNSDNVKDVANMDILSVYKNLDFINDSTEHQFERNYFTYLNKYDDNFELPRYQRYEVITPSETEKGTGRVRITYFDYYREYKLSFTASTHGFIGNVKFTENSNTLSLKDTVRQSPLVQTDYIGDLYMTDLYFPPIDKVYRDKPYDATYGTISIKQVAGREIQTYTVANSNRRHVEFTRVLEDGTVGEWQGHGTIDRPMFLNIPGNYHSEVGYTPQQLKSNDPNHAVFQNPISHEIIVDGSSNLRTHVTYRLTNQEGLVIEYHNIAVRMPVDGRIPMTAQKYTLLYDKWIPGEYVGNSDHPYSPDPDAQTQKLIERITNTEKVLKEIINNYKKIGAWDPNGQPAPESDNVEIKGSIKPNVNFAYGNINLFGGTPDGDFYIRTNAGSTENDLAGGLV